MKIDVTYKEVENSDRRCSSGHIASDSYKRNGPESKSEPTRFFKVSGKKIPSGIYCEPCLVIANYIARR